MHHHRHRSKRRRRMTAGIAAALLLILALGFAVIRMEQLAGGKSQYTDNAQLTIGDSLYRQLDQTVVLILGTDDLGPIQSSNSYTNTQQADFLVVMAIDHKQNSYSLLQIDRDTMVDIDFLDISGARTGQKVNGQIALSHNYGDGLESSCMNTKRAVSNLLYGLRIDQYIALNMSAVEKLVDHMGGVPVHLDADYTAIDPAFRKGARLTLTGEQALAFVRARRGVDDGTNVARMARQRIFMDAFLSQIGKLEPSEGELKDAFYSIAGLDSDGQRYLVTDATFQKLADLFEVVSTGSCSGLYALEGTRNYADTYVQFYPDPDQLADLATSLYFKPVH